VTGLKIRVLGSPQVEVDGDPLEVDTRKAVALLARLTVTGQDRRDALTALLWPTSDETRARAALRRTLSALNAGLGHRWVDADRDQLRLVGDDVWSDVAAFHELRNEHPDHQHPSGASCDACLRALESSVALYRGRFLAGFTLRDSPAFDDWCSAEAEHFERAVCETLDRLVEVLTHRGELEAADVHAHRRLELEPLHEATYRRLMLLHAWRDQRAEAMQIYQSCVAVLDQELGVPPVERTTSLHEAIVAGRPSARAPSASPRARRRPPAHPLVGREEELVRARAAYDAAAHGGSLLVLSGEAGVGKTRLASEVAETARGRGAATVTVQSYREEQTIAYGVTAELLRASAPEAPDQLASIPRAWLRDAARLAPELLTPLEELPPPDPLSGPEAHRRFLEALRQVIAGGLSGEVAGLVVIDDVHWADDASQESLAYLLRRLDDLPLCVVLTWRDDLLADAHPLRLISQGREVAGGGAHIELERLAPDDITALATAMGTSLTAEQREQLAQGSEGLPLFAVEYLRTLTDAADRALDGTPAGIQRVVEERLGRLSDTTRQILSAAAVIGRWFDIDTVLAASGRDAEETVEALEELAEADIVAELAADPPRYDFRHDQLRAAVYERTSAARRRLLHGRVADALAGRPATRERRTASAVLARHLSLAGRDQEAAAAYVAAADGSESLSAHAEAAEHIRAALGLGHPDRCTLKTRLGDLLTRQGAYPDALQAYTAATANCQDDGERARIEHRVAMVHERRGDQEATRAHIEAGLAALPPTGASSLRARLHVDRALLAHRQGDVDVAEQEVRHALNLADEAADDVARAQALNLLGMLERTHGAIEDAIGCLQQSLGLAEELDQLDPQVAALNNLALAHADNGELAAGLELAKRALALCRRRGDRHREAAILNNIADLLHDLGQREESERYLTRAVTIFAEIGTPDHHEPGIWKLADW